MSNPAPGPALSPEFGSSLPMALLRAREAVMLRLRPVLRDHGVTEQQWRVLRTLAACGQGMEAARLARESFLLRPSLTRILRDLQVRGLVERRAAAASPRRSLIAISARGLALIEAAADAATHANAEIEAAIGAADMAELRRVLARVETVLNGPATPHRSAARAVGAGS